MAKDTKDNRIGMRVSTDQKQRWEREAMDRGFSSLAAFITYTLEDEILRKQQPDQQQYDRPI